MSKLVQKVKWDLGRPHAEITEMYMYGEADLEANKAMQEPLEKLYQYENQPDMREKVKEYIGELEIEIDRIGAEYIIGLGAIDEWINMEFIWLHERVISKGGK